MAAVLIADDHALIRDGLKGILREDRFVSAIGEAKTGSETIARLNERRWDLLILDINMPDRSGVDILRHVCAMHPETRVLILSGFPEQQYAVNVMRAGASGYLNKEASLEEMISAIQTVLRGRRYVSARVAEQLVHDIDADRTKSQHSSLSDREFQIFRKLASGQSVSDIADELCISVKTVSTYRARILEKMSFTTNADLTAYALRNQIIQ